MQLQIQLLDSSSQGRLVITRVAAYIQCMLVTCGQHPLPALHAAVWGLLANAFMYRQHSQSEGMVNWNDLCVRVLVSSPFPQGLACCLALHWAVVTGTWCVDVC